MEGPGEENFTGSARAEDSGYVGGENGSITPQDATVEMDTGEDDNQTARKIATSDVPKGSVERSKTEHRVMDLSTNTACEVVGNGAIGDVVKGDFSEGVKVSHAECDTGAEGAKSHSVKSEGVRGAEGGGGGPRSEQEKQLWTAVTANSSDFTSWTALLQMVEQNCVLEPARKAFHQFLRLYPYCYGYWKKYSDLVKKLCGDERAREVLEEGVAAVPLSVDLWLHYTTFAVSFYSGSPQAEQLIRSVYERAVEKCGLDFRSAKIWEAYIAWESGSGRQRHVMAIYDKLLAIPTKELQTHFENFKKLLQSSPSSQLLCEAEFQDVSSQAGDAVQGEAMLDSFVRKVTLERRTAVFERTVMECERIKQFELMIKRPYFHVKPLERLQLKNWRDYLDFEISEGNPRRIEFLFERCMIACALYEDFWSKYYKYAEVHIHERASSIYRRACTIHLRQKPNIHVAWAAFEEKSGNVERAREILTAIDDVVPGVVMVRLRRIGLEIRAGRYDEADTLYQESLSATISLELRNFYAWRYARFCDKLMGNHTKAVFVMTSAIDMDPSNSRLYLQLLDLHMSGHTPPDMAAAEALFENVATSSNLTDEVKESFLARRQQLLEEFGGNISDLLEVTERCEKVKRSARKRLASELESDAAKKLRVEPLAIASPTTTQMGVAPPLTPEQQQWAAYQQQWGGYNYTQPQQGYNLQGYYPPYSYAQQSTT